MPPNLPDNQARRRAGQTQHDPTNGCLLLGAEGDEAILIIAARQPDERAA